MVRLSLSALGIVGLGAVLTLGSVYLASQEAAPYLRVANFSSQRVLQASADPSSALGWSEASVRTTLSDCRFNLANPQSRSMAAISEDERRLVAQTCLALADDAVSRFPASSYMYLVRSIARLSNGDSEGASDDFAISRSIGPSEQWIAELRIAFAEDNFASLSPDAVAAQADDIRLLMISGRGLQSLSQRYVDSPQFRERIAAVAETMPEDVQARFLRFVTRRIPR